MIEFVAVLIELVICFVLIGCLIAMAVMGVCGRG
jgi:hypothetical protein